jgi:hypothetical protein
MNEIDFNWRLLSDSNVYKLYINVLMERALMLRGPSSRGVFHLH